MRSTAELEASLQNLPHLDLDPGVAGDALLATEQDIEELVSQTATLLYSLVRDRLPENYQPLGDRILVRPLMSEDTVLKNGLYRINQRQDASSHGLVVAVGPGLLTKAGERIPLEVEPGQCILFSKYSGATVQLGGAYFLMLKISDVLAVEL